MFELCIFFLSLCLLVLSCDMHECAYCSSIHDNLYDFFVNTFLFTFCDCISACGKGKDPIFAQIISGVPFNHLFHLTITE